MPDWSYRTVLRPLLFLFPPETARDLCLGTIGALGRSRIGSAVIDFLGHMRADPRLETRILGRIFPTAVGLGAGLDPDAIATPGLARFGFGFLELGPVTVEPITAPGTTTRDLEHEAITRPDPAPNPGLVALVRRLARDGRPPLPLLARLAVTPAAMPEEATHDVRRMILQMAPYVDVFVRHASRRGGRRLGRGGVPRAPASRCGGYPGVRAGAEPPQLRTDGAGRFGLRANRRPGVRGGHRGRGRGWICAR